MQKLKLQSIAAETVTRIEICLPRIFSWKLRGGEAAPRGFNKESFTHMEENQ